MIYAKLAVALIFLILFTISCSTAPAPVSPPVSDNKSYAASLFRQNCAICHGPEADGKTLTDGKVIPSLKSGEHKFKTETEIYNQIDNGGNGMLPFRDQLTDREIKSLVDFVRKDIRHQQ